MRRTVAAAVAPDPATTALAEAAAAEAQRKASPVLASGVDAKRGFPWWGALLLLACLALIGPLGRRAHHLGLEVRLRMRATGRAP